MLPIGVEAEIDWTVTRRDVFEVFQAAVWIGYCAVYIFYFLLLLRTFIQLYHDALVWTLFIIIN